MSIRTTLKIQREIKVLFLFENFLNVGYFRGGLFMYNKTLKNNQKTEVSENLICMCGSLTFLNEEVILY